MTIPKSFELRIQRYRCTQIDAMQAQAKTITRHESSECPKCGNNIVSRLLTNDELRNNSPNSVTSSSKHSKKNRSKKLLKDFELYSDTRLTLNQMTTLMAYSKKPIYCPNSDCLKIVAVTHLIPHFQFDHSNIPHAQLQFNEPKTLLLHMNNMEYGKNHCIALLLVSEATNCYSDDVSQSLKVNGIAFPLLAAKLHCKTADSSHPTERSKISDDNNSINALELNNTDIVIIWICGNLDHKIKCLIEVSDEKQSRIYSYYGIINHLRDDNDPNAVFLRADCLLLHSSNIHKITQNGRSPLELKIVIAYPYNNLLMINKLN